MLSLIRLRDYVRNDDISPILTFLSHRTSHGLLIFYGSGNNGKTTLINHIKELNPDIYIAKIETDYEEDIINISLSRRVIYEVNIMPSHDVRVAGTLIQFPNVFNYHDSQH